MKPAARALAHVVPALGTDVGVALELRPVEHRIALRAFRPQPFGNGPPARAIGPNPRRQQSPEPAHDVAASIALRNSPMKAARMSGSASGDPAFASTLETTALPTTTASAIRAIRAADAPS